MAIYKLATPTIFLQQLAEKYNPQLLLTTENVLLQANLYRSGGHDLFVC